MIDDISKNQFLISASERKAGELPQSHFPFKKGEEKHETCHQSGVSIMKATKREDGKR